MNKTYKIKKNFMLANLFYFCGLFIFLFHLILLANFGKLLYVKDFIKKFKKVTNKNPEKENFSENDYQFGALVSVTVSLNFFWSFLGLIGQNWIIFMIFFVCNLLIGGITSMNKSKLINNTLEFTRWTLNAFIIGLLVFNHFHLHLSLSKFILP